MIKDRAIMRNLKMGATYSRNLKRIIVEVSGVLTLIFLMCGSSSYANADSEVFNVTSYGAVGNARTCCTAAIQKAIDVCAVRGGGCVYFPPGSYLTGTLILKSNVSLKLEAGATLLGSEDLSDYELPYLIYAKDARNISIRGAGSVNGQGEIFWRGKKRPYKRPSKMIQLEDCRDVRIEDITLTNSPNWTLNLVRCDWVFIDGITIRNFREAPNTDGIDPSSSSNVFISNCYIDTGDDAICLKVNETDKPCENIVVTNCVLISDDSAIKCGTGSEGTIRHCVFSNIVIRNTQYGIAFYMKGGGSYEDIQFSNINIETTKLAGPDKGGRNIFPVFMDIEPRDAKTALGTIRNIVFRNVTIETQNGNCLIQGAKDKPLEDITLQNVRLRVLSRVGFSGRTKPRGTRTLKERAPNDYADVPAHFTFAHIKGLTLENLFIRDEVESTTHERHAIWGLDLEDVTLSSLSPRQAALNERLALLLLKNSKNVLVRGCHAIRSTAAFLRLEGKQTDNVVVIDGNLRGVEKIIERGADVVGRVYLQSDSNRSVHK
jgi:hypothetical protein